MADDPDKPYWRLIARSKRHAYYRPSDNRPGIALFALIGMLGLTALGFAFVHWRRLGVLGHDDKVLSIIGAGCLALGLYQALKLATDDPSLTSADRSVPPPERSARGLLRRIGRQRRK